LSSEVLTAFHVCIHAVQAVEAESPHKQKNRQVRAQRWYVVRHEMFSQPNGPLREYRGFFGSERSKNFRRCIIDAFALFLEHNKRDNGEDELTQRIAVILEEAEEFKETQRKDIESVNIAEENLSVQLKSEEDFGWLLKVRGQN